MYTQKTNLSKAASSVNYHDSFHVYAAEWDPEQIRFYVDGVHYYTVRNSTVGNFLTSSQTNPMRLIINTAIGGDFSAQSRRIDSMAASLSKSTTFMSTIGTEILS